MFVSLDEPEPIDSVLTFLSGYDTLEYSWVKVIAVSVRLRILFVTLQNTNTQRTPCDLQTAIKNLMFTIAYGTAMPTQPGDVYNGQQIPPGYTRVGVEQVCQGWETLELDIPGGDGERTLAEAIHG